MKRFAVVFVIFLAVAMCSQFPVQAAEPPGVPVLCYHRFGPRFADSMTTTTPVFEAQLKWLQENGYTVIPLRTLVDYLLGQGPPPPPKAVVITADDAHKTVYTDMLPLVKKYNIPVTIFVYPSAVSRADYVMTWEQLKELQDTGLFDLQSHTFWHPNFKKEKKKLKPEEYQKLVHDQLTKSKASLERRFGKTVDILAWPFGIYDEELEQAAAKAGYVAAFSIERRLANPSERIMAQPRYIITEVDKVKGFAAMVSGQVIEKGPRTY